MPGAATTDIPIVLRGKPYTKRLAKISGTALGPHERAACAWSIDFYYGMWSQTLGPIELGGPEAAPTLAQIVSLCRAESWEDLKDKIVWVLLDEKGAIEGLMTLPWNGAETFFLPFAPQPVGVVILGGTGAPGGRVKASLRCVQRRSKPRRGTRRRRRR